MRNMRPEVLQTFLNADLVTEEALDFHALASEDHVRELRGKTCVCEESLKAQAVTLHYLSLQKGRAS